MNELQVFSHKDLGGVRVLELDGQPWFVGKDVAGILGYSNSRDAIKNHVDEEDKGVVKHDTLGGKQELVIINESGLYALILHSKLPKAKQFKRWVTSEVLPSIRKSGSYGNETERIVKMTTQIIAEQLPSIISATVEATLKASGGNNQNNDTKHKKYRNYSKIDFLPSEVRDKLIYMLFTEKRTYTDVTQEIRNLGYDISRSGIGRFGIKLSKNLDNISSITIESEDK